MNTIFKNKSKFHAMKAQWALSSKSSKCKSTLVPCDEWLKYNDRLSKGTGTHRVKGWMQSEHHILYNILRDLPVNRGFSPISNKNKMISKPDAALDGLINLRTMQQYAIDVIAGETSDRNASLKYRQQSVNWLLAPFGDTITPEILVKLVIPSIHSIPTIVDKHESLAV